MKVFIADKRKAVSATPLREKAVSQLNALLGLELVEQGPDKSWMLLADASVRHSPRAEYSLLEFEGIGQLLVHCGPWIPSTVSRRARTCKEWVESDACQATLAALLAHVSDAMRCDSECVAVYPGIFPVHMELLDDGLLLGDRMFTILIDSPSEG